ncbi:MAG: hypothetical protein ABW001_08160 [Mycobacterium sp.]
MNDQARKTRMRGKWTAEHDDALQRLAQAHDRVKESDTSVSRDELSRAVDAARAVGIGWTMIGNALGIASGNAYHRYRKRPTNDCHAGGTRD